MCDRVLQAPIPAFGVRILCTLASLSNESRHRKKRHPALSTDTSGERAIRILAPMKVTLADDDPAPGNDAGEDERTRVFFRAVGVFDRSRADPLPDREPTTLEPPTQPITGNSCAHLIAPSTFSPASWVTACKNATTPAPRAAGASPTTS
jgi:hypothetical protein